MFPHIAVIDPSQFFFKNRKQQTHHIQLYPESFCLGAGYRNNLLFVPPGGNGGQKIKVSQQLIPIFTANNGKKPRAVQPVLHPSGYFDTDQECNLEGQEK